jgi:hypothetical protein
MSLLISSFILGITMDCFCNSAGVHALASIVLAYYRPLLFKFCFGLSYEYQTVRINDNLTPERFFFILLAIVLHHSLLFIAEMFNIFLIFEIFYKTILTSLFTVIISIVIIYLIKPNKK